MFNKQNTDKKMLSFKKRPLLRCGDVIYYGDKKNRFIVEVNIKSSHDVQCLKVADKVSVKLLDTDPNISENKKIIKMSEKNGLYNALDIGAIWLDRAIEFNAQ